MSKPRERAQAMSLRKQGHSYAEISKKLSISKSTCSNWLRNIRLDSKAIQRLVDLQDEGRKNSAHTLKQYGQERDDYIKEKVNKSLENFVCTPEVGKLLCASLYWAEGEKKSSCVAFSNSNPVMIRVYLSLLRSYFSIEEKKIKALLHLHSYHDVGKQKYFWSKVTDIPKGRIAIYRKPNSGVNVRKGYPGCISIRYHDVRLAKEILFLYTALIEKI